jgi:hypothetical protein
MGITSSVDSKDKYISGVLFKGPDLNNPDRIVGFYVSDFYKNEYIPMYYDVKHDEPPQSTPVNSHGFSIKFEPGWFLSGINVVHMSARSSNSTLKEKWTFIISNNHTTKSDANVYFMNKTNAPFSNYDNSQFMCDNTQFIQTINHYDVLMSSDTESNKNIYYKYTCQDPPKPTTPLVVVRESEPNQQASIMIPVATITLPTPLNQATTTTTHTSNSAGNTGMLSIGGGVTSHQPDAGQLTEVPQLIEVSQSTVVSQSTAVSQSTEVPQSTAVSQSPEIVNIISDNDTIKYVGASMAFIFFLIMLIIMTRKPRVNVSTTSMVPTTQSETAV